MPNIALRTFNAGLWIAGERGSVDPQPEFVVPTNSLLQADNIEYLDAGGVRGRRGYAKYDEATLADSVVGMFRHYPRALITRQGHSKPVIIENAALVPNGTKTWVDPQEAESDNNAFAYCQFTNPFEISYYLQMLNPYQGVNEIPGSCEVTGIVVGIRRRARPNPGVRDYTVQLALAGTLLGENKAVTSIQWGGEYETIRYGGAGDLWGYPWTAAEINNALFAVMFQCESTLTIQQGQVEFIDVEVYCRQPIDPSLIVAHDDGGIVLYSKPVVDGGGSGWMQLQDREDPPADYAPVLQTSHRPRFVSWHSQDRTYIFDGRNPVVLYDGIGITPGPADAVRGPYAALWKARLWATDPNELNYSVYASGVNDPNDWNAARSHLNVADTRGGIITGLVGRDDRILIFKDSGLWSFVGDIDTGGQLREYSRFGAVASESIADSEYGVFYVGHDGVYLTDGESETPIEISRPIRPLFISRGTQEIFRDAVCVYYPFKRQLFLKLDPSLAETWVCQIIQGEEGPLFAWARIPTHPFNAGCVFSYSPDNGEVLVGSTDGTVRQLDVEVNTDDDGELITAVVKTPYARMSSKGVHGRATHLKTVARHQVQLSGLILYDEGDSQVATGELGLAALEAPDYQHSRVWVSSLSVQGHNVSARITNAGDSYNFELHEVEIRLALRQPRRWQS